MPKIETLIIGYGESANYYHVGCTVRGHIGTEKCKTIGSISEVFNEDGHAHFVIVSQTNTVLAKISSDSYQALYESENA